jgi:glutaredoxin 3
MIIEIYTTNFCGYCILAKKLLNRINVPFSETNVTLKPKKRIEMVERSGGSHSVPQIFISDIDIGGYQELYQLEKIGRLDTILMKSKC